MNRMERHHRYCNALAKANPEQRKRLIQYATPQQVDAVSEMAYNVLERNVPLEKRTLGRLKKFKSHIRGMGNPRLPLAVRRRWFQRGGGGAVQALVRGVAQGLKQGAKKGLEQQKGKLMQGLKEGAQKGIQRWLPTNVSSTNDDDDNDPDTVARRRSSVQTKIDQLQQDIEQMELALKQKS